MERRSAIATSPILSPECAIVLDFEEKRSCLLSQVCFYLFDDEELTLGLFGSDLEEELCENFLVLLCLQIVVPSLLSVVQLDESLAT